MNADYVIDKVEDLLWECISNYIETSEYSKSEIHNIAVKSNFQHYSPNCGETVERLDILDIDDFNITDYKTFGDSIIVSFEMIFTAIVNKDSDKFYHIASTAAGTLSVPTGNRFDYEEYDFDDMNRLELLSHSDIIENFNLHFEDVEYMGE